MLYKRSLLAVDPGKKACGVAYFEDGVLVRCGLPRGVGAYETALAVEGWLTFRPILPVIDDLVVEGQQVYGGRIRADPNDLLPLAQVVGAVFARVPHLNRANPLPRQWKGSVAKDVFTARIRAALTDPEAELLSSLELPKSTEHNVLDAIGLGKWWLKHV